MARDEQHREDLLRQATALSRRVELAVDGFSENVVLGFRRGGEASVFFGSDPVYQFDSHDQLRRAFHHDRLLKAEDGRLVALRRHRTPTEVQLVRHALDESQTAGLLLEARSQLAHLHAQLLAGKFELVGQVPPHEPVTQQAMAWLAALPEEIAVAARPNVQ